MNEDVLSKKIVSNLIPNIEDIIIKHKDFSSLFSNLKSIIWFQDANIVCDENPNPATDDGIYPHQSILRFIFRSRIVDFDLLEGKILEEKYTILEDDNNLVLYYLDTYDVVYTKDELIAALEFKNSMIGELANLKYKTSSYSDEEFKKLLINDYHIVFDTNDVYLEKEDSNFRLYLDIDLSNHDINFNGLAAFFKEIWQEKINLEETLENIKENEGSEINE